MISIHKYYSYAKLNLGLKVLNKRKDGYHNIHSFFIEIDLSDELIFKSSSNFDLTSNYKGDIQFPLDNNNLIYKAYKLMYSKTDLIDSEYSIFVKKNIPLGSGLGGGSSNAATTLKTLNQLWDMKLSQERLEKLGLTLGADIPFFIRGGFQLVEGVGEKLVSLDIDIVKKLYFLIVVPPIYISTLEAYGLLNKPLSPKLSHSKFPPVSKPIAWQLFDNDFENVIGKTYPEINEIKHSLASCGALFSGLSGSGSAVFGVFQNLHIANVARGKFPNYQTFLTIPVFHS